MNLVDELLNVDVEEAKTSFEPKKGVFMSKRMQEILKKDEPVDIEIHALKQRRVNDIMAYQMKNDGNIDFAKSFDAKLMLIVEGCSGIDFTSEELKKKFGCSSANKLAEKLLAEEITAMSDQIAALSGVGGEDEEKEEEVKN